ncbi:hypothetical protein EYS09_33325, partial [Streptomyces kasugaensis]
VPDSHPDAERREAEERPAEERPAGEDAAERAPAADWWVPAVPPPDPAPAGVRPVSPVGADDSSPSGETTGASPHTPQYSSPPPTSS